MATIIQSLNGSDPVLEPTRYNINKSDLYSDQSGRSAESGDMILYLVKKNVYSLELEFVGTAAQIKFIDSLLEGVPSGASTSGEFSVTFLDEVNNESQSTYVTRRMYASDRKLEMLGTPNSRMHRLSFNLIETRRNS